MKKIYSFFLLLGLLLSVGNAWGETKTKTEGFETQAATTTYNGTVTITTGKSDCGIGWKIYYGTVSTNDKISGSKSAQMRWYASSTSNYPYAETTTAVEGLSKVELKARTSSTDVKMDISYSEDGTNWTVGKTHTFAATGVAEAESLNIPDGNKFVKFSVATSSTAPSSGNYKLIVDDVVLTYIDAATGEDATWSLNPASATVMAGENTALQLTTNYDGTLSFESEDTNIATVSYNSSTKVLTVTGVAAGVTSISATGAATATYKAISKLIDVTVSHAELTSNVMDEMSGFGYAYFGLTPIGGGSDYAQPEETTRSKTDGYGVEIVFNKETSTTNTRYDANCVRFYKNAQLVITAPSGSYITKIVLLEPETGKSWSGTITPDGGDYVSDVKTWYATSTGVTSVTLDNPDAAKRIGGLEVYMMMSSDTRTLGANGYSTYAAPFKCTISGATVYKAALNGNKDAVILSEVTDAVVPAGEGIILKGTEGATVTITPSAAAVSDFTDNELVGVVQATAATAGMYVLSTNAGVTAFNPCQVGLLIPALKAYISVPASAPSVIRIIEGENNATDINNIEANEEAVKFMENGKLYIKKNGVIYNVVGAVVK